MYWTLKKSQKHWNIFFLINSLANFHLPVLVQTLLQLLSMYLPFALKLLSAVFCPISLTSNREDDFRCPETWQKGSRVQSYPRAAEIKNRSAVDRKTHKEAAIKKTMQAMLQEKLHIRINKKKKERRYHTIHFLYEWSVPLSTVWPYKVSCVWSSTSLAYFFLIFYREHIWSDYDWWISQ